MKPAIRNLCLLHLFGNALLLWSGYYWLGVGESSVRALGWSAFVAVACVCAALWLHGVALAHFRAGGSSGLAAALKSALRNLFPLVLIALAALGIYLLLARWQNYSSQPAFKIASYITLKLRKPLKPAVVSSVFDAVFWIVRWALLPVILLPLAAGIAGLGWSGFRSGFWKLAKRWLYWIEVPALLLCAFWVPLKLIGWVPHMSGFRMEMASFVVRAVVAYLLMAGALLVLEFFTGRGSASAGSPRSSQVSTVASP
jgi:hypothetical protein